MEPLKKWISNGTDRPFYARKTFDISGEIDHAEALVCGLGQFNFFLNGRKVSDHVLDPAWTDYRKRVQFVRFDVTPYLSPGKNALGAEVGNGWFIKNDAHYTFRFPEFMPPNPNDYRPFARMLMLAVKLAVCYKDGRKIEIVSDESFHVCEHPVIVSNVYGSEIIDGRKAQPGWNTAAFAEKASETAWHPAVIVPEAELPMGVFNQTEQVMPPVKMIHTYEGCFLKMLGSCRAVYDFGQNTSFLLELEVRGRRGDVVRIYPAEKLTSDGDVDQVAKGWCTVDTIVEYTIGSDDAWETVSSVFTYLAGRYVGIDMPNAAVRNIRAHAITSAWKQSGSFTCDDERFCRIYDMVEKTVEANMVGVHTDCPTIERFAWQEPNHLMAPSIMYMKDSRSLWVKFLGDMRDAQHRAEDVFHDLAGNAFCPGDGLVPSQAPCYIPNVLPVPGMGSFYDLIPWGSSSILGTYWHYLFYGDVTVIEENYEMGMRYLRYLMTKVNEDGFINHGLGDWGNPEQTLVRENIETAFLYADAVTLAGFADILNRKDEAAWLREQAEHICKNYNDKLLVYHEEAGIWCYKAWDHPDGFLMTQAAEALPLYWGMVPDSHIEDVVKALRMTLEEKQAFLCGEIGLPYVIQCAGRYGMNDLICRFILKEHHPSYYAFIKDGETTLGEYWETNPRSHCHDMMGHIVEWYYNGIAGIIPEAPGFAKVLIKPYLPESICEMTCTYQSVNGPISVEMKRRDKSVALKITVDEHIRYRVDDSNLLREGYEVAVSGNGSEMSSQHN